MRSTWCVAVALAATACTKTNPLDCSDGTCSDPAHPYCDKDGTVAGTPNACIAVACMAPSAFVECRGDVAVSCDASGSGYQLTNCTQGCSTAAAGCNTCAPDASFCTSQGVQHCGSDGAPSSLDICAEGCVDTPTPHCEYLAARYLTGVCDAIATDALDITGNATLGTDLDTSCTGGIIQQTAAPDICVIRNKTITIDGGVTLKATGARLLALVADDTVAVHGTLDASADGATSGAGGGSVKSGGARTIADGGGGAGFKTAGAAGASSSADGGAANAGPVQTDPALLAVMVGGPQGGGGTGGGGGGGVILVACRGSVAIDGTIDLGGGGGPGGSKLVNNPVFGGGGGGGGYLVVQGWNVNITGSVYANGGGGGAGYTGAATGNAGQDGSRSTSVAAIGGAAPSGGGPGGVGAVGQLAAGVGVHSVNGGNGGGGGGGVGFLQTYTPMGVTPTIMPTESSPAFQANQTVGTK